MADFSVTNYLKYANLQMAAEALYEFNPNLTGGKTSAGATAAYPTIPATFLTEGNNRSSRFTSTQAQAFIAEGWTVVEHISNTTTGFSGPLFRGKTGELVMSFRSTEFADDARDNQATNTLEIKEQGWAFGQLPSVTTGVLQHG